MKVYLLYLSVYYGWTNISNFHKVSFGSVWCFFINRSRIVYYLDLYYLFFYINKNIYNKEVFEAISGKKLFNKAQQKYNQQFFLNLSNFYFSNLGQVDLN